MTDQTKNDETADALREAAQAVLDNADCPGSRMHFESGPNGEDVWVDHKEVDQPVLDRLAAVLSDRATEGEGEDEQNRDAWNDFEGTHLTDGNGYAAADVYRRCREAFDAALPSGRIAARAAAVAALPHAYLAPARQPIADLTGEVVEVENVAWDWLESQYLHVKEGCDPADRDYSPDDMIDAFIAGRQHAPSIATLTAGLAQTEGETLPDREDIARVLFDQRQTGHDFDDAADADSESDAGTLRSICFDDADAVIALTARAALADPQARGKGGAE